MDNDQLYDRIETAAKFVGEQSGVIISHQEQMTTGLEWASRQQERPAPEPVAPMKPIVAVA